MSDFVYTAARGMIADLAAKTISASELLDAHLARNDALHPKLNAVVIADRARAVAEATAVDEARAQGKPLGPLAGLPMTVKEAYDIAGMPATAGAPEWQGRAKTCEDAALVSRLRKTGAIVWGKTNVPYMLADWQSYNDIYGTTNNPWDVTRVPGGSSGGSAAALAAGISPLELGSDIGGSLRHPSAFCGTLALKPTWDLLPMRGHLPPPPEVFSDIDLAVGGPMARDAEDLRLLFGVLSGTAQPARAAVKGLRIAVWDSEPGFPVSSDIAAGLARATSALREAGAIIEAAKPDIQGGDLLGVYMQILMPIISNTATPEAIAYMLASARDRADEPGAALKDFADMVAALKARNAMKSKLARFFDQGWDAILMPTGPVTAFPHDQTGTMTDRTIQVDGQAQPYASMLNWIAVGTALHVPALSAPSGLSATGLPTGVQLVAPWGHEARLLDLAAALGDRLPFQAPPL